MAAASNPPPMNSPKSHSKLGAGENSFFPSPEDARMDNVAKKSAWNKPLNNVVVGVGGGSLEEASTVMGDECWPALSEWTRASPKSSSSDSLKALSDGSFSLSQGSVIASSSLSHNEINNANPNSTPNHVGLPMRQRSMKRGSGTSKSNNVLTNGGFPQQPQGGSVVEFPASNLGKSDGGDHPHKETGQKGCFESQTHSRNDHHHHQQQHHQQRNSLRRVNSGPHQRGDGSYHHGYGGRRGQVSGNQDWNRQRSFNGRDNHLQPQRGFPRGFIQPTPHSNTPFMQTPPVTLRPFGNHMMYPDVASHVFYVGPPPEPFRGMPIVAPMQPMFFPIPDPQLYTKIVNQIEYYFSNDNLIKDTFLRQNMDDQGWVPIKLIAGFKKTSQGVVLDASINHQTILFEFCLGVLPGGADSATVLHLTEDIQLILDALRTSTVVETQGEKVRKQNDWIKWLMPPASVQCSTVSSPQSIQSSNHDALVAHLRSVTLDENNANHGQAEIYLSRSSSGELSSQSQQFSYEGTSQVTVRAGFERSTSL